jgi:hypothetical protein
MPSERQLDCLKFMHDCSPNPNDGQVIFYAHITQEFECDLGQARRAVRALVRTGLASRETAFDDDGYIRGSGFMITHAGVSVLREVGRL